jgi:hypothetical protein
MEIEIIMVDRFYGDGDHHVNTGNTDSQLYVCHSYHFTSTCDNVFSVYGRSRPIDRSQCLSLNALPTKLCSIACLIQLVVGL